MKLRFMEFRNDAKISITNQESFSEKEKEGFYLDFMME